MRRPVEPISSPGSVVRLVVLHLGSRIARTTLRHGSSVLRQVVPLEVLPPGSVEVKTVTVVMVAVTVDPEDTMADTAVATNLEVVVLHGSAAVVTMAHVAVLHHGKCHNSRRLATALLAWTSTLRRPLLHLVAFLLRPRRPATTFPRLRHHRSSAPRKSTLA